MRKGMRRVEVYYTVSLLKGLKIQGGPVKKLIYLMTILGFLIVFMGGCGGSSEFVTDRWSGEIIRKAPPELMSLLEQAGGRRDWPNAHTVSIYEVDSTFFYPDGNQVTYNYSFMKLLTMKATKDYGTIPIPYDTQQMTIDIVYVRVIYPDSSVVTVTDSAITDETMEDYAQMDIYWSNLRQKVIHMPELKVGCGVEFALNIRTVQPMLEGMMDYRAGFQSSEPILNTDAILVVPDEVEMNWKVYNDEDGRVQSSEDVVDDSLRVYRWSASDMQMMITEDGMPPAGEFLTKVLASNTTWEEYSEKVYDLSKENMVADDAIRATVAELMKDAESDIDSMRAIFYYTAQEVRYIGLSLGAKEGITPHDVRETFEAQCGVCKDKSALLAVMLQEAGFEAYVALSNPVNHVYKEIAANQFNHMIVVGYDRDGNEHWMDPTDHLCMDMLPAYHMEKAVLICKEGGSDLRYLPVLPPMTQGGKIDAKSIITDDGTYHSTVTITGKGMYDEILRLIFQQMEPTRQRRFWTDMLKNQIHPEARIVDFKVTPEPITDLWDPVVLTIDYEIPDYAIVADDYLLVKVPVATGAFDIMSLVTGQTTSLSERDYPLNIQFTFGTLTNEEIELPGGYQPKSIPAEISMENEVSSFNMDYEIEGNSAKYISSLKVSQPRIEPEIYPEFRKTMKKAGSAGQGMLILTREGDA